MRRRRFLRAIIGGVAGVLMAPKAMLMAKPTEAGLVFGLTEEWPERDGQRYPSGMHRIDVTTAASDQREYVMVYGG